MLTGIPSEHIAAAMRTLSDHYRMTVYLADVKGYSYGEIAAMTGTTTGTVKSRLHRARSRLRVLIAAPQPGRRPEGLATLGRQSLAGSWPAQHPGQHGS